MATYKQFLRKQEFCCPHCEAKLRAVPGAKGQMLAILVWIIGAGLVCFGCYYSLWWLALPGAGSFFIHLEMFPRFRARYLSEFRLY